MEKRTLAEYNRKRYAIDLEYIRRHKGIRWYELKKLNAINKWYKNIIKELNNE